MAGRCYVYQSSSVVDEESPEHVYVVGLLRKTD